MDHRDRNNEGSAGGFVERTSADYEMRSQGVGIPVYEKYKGKEAYASKEWKTTKGEGRALAILMTVLALMLIAVVILQFLSIPMWVKIVAFVAAIVLFIASIGIFVLVVALRHNKQDPAQMHYYDVDYEHNHITGEGYDNTREISKEEFYSGGQRPD